ncbi:MAG TPA: hypothetical protein VN892_17540 [Solirubrobacteraceae bacterium]|nr:hypothetical protein [Solirubrobacteraceae bacterium]
MAQISRPFQVVIVVFVLFVGAYAAWFLVLRTPAPSTPTPVATSPAPAPRIHTLKTPESGKVYHGAAPGLEGLTRDVAKAHGAVSAAHASGEHELAQGGAAPSGASATATGSAATPTAPATHASTRAAPSSSAAASIAKPAQHSAAKSTTSTPAPSRSKTAQAPSNLSQVPARQAQVEHALKEGKIAVILFWNPKGADDVADQAELRLLEAVHRLIPGLARRVPAVRAELKHSGLELEKKFAAFEARADQVTSFGTITRGVQVYETPTLLVVNPNGQVTTITGLTDAFAIEQAIDEARHA